MILGIDHEFDPEKPKRDIVTNSEPRFPLDPPSIPITPEIVAQMAERERQLEALRSWELRRRQLEALRGKIAAMEGRRNG